MQGKKILANPLPKWEIQIWFISVTKLHLMRILIAIRTRRQKIKNAPELDVDKKDGITCCSRTQCQSLKQTMTIWFYFLFLFFFWLPGVVADDGGEGKTTVFVGGFGTVIDRGVYCVWLKLKNLPLPLY